MRSPARDELRMAAKKKAAGARREPTFEDDDGPELRATASDRASSADSAPSSKPRKRRARKKRPARGIGARIGRIAYWGLVAGLWFGEAYLVVSQDHRPADERLYAGGSEFSVKVDDLDAQHARLHQAGVAVTAIKAQPWGERNFNFKDPDGYPWCYGQPAG